MFRKVFNDIDLKETKTGKSKWWFGTWNNPGPDWKAKVDSFGATYAASQLEQGE